MYWLIGGAIILTLLIDVIIGKQIIKKVRKKDERDKNISDGK